MLEKKAEGWQNPRRTALNASIIYEQYPYNISFKNKPQNRNNKYLIILTLHLAILKQQIGTMGKEDKKQKRGTSKSSSKDIFGRPADVPIEAVFMTKLREGKLQSITAESQAQIYCGKFADKNPEIYANRSLKPNDEEDNFAKEKVCWVVNWFKKYFSQPLDHQTLWTSYRHAQEVFQFKEIKQGQDFPNYLFLDECDLSYVLFTVLNSQTESLKDKVEFTNIELFFFEMLCFANRDMISFKVLEALSENFQQILHNMDGFAEKIHEQYLKNIEKVPEGEKQGIVNEKRQGKQEKSHIFDDNQEAEIPIILRKGDFFTNSPSEETIEAASGQLKRKFIKKEEKKKTAGRPKSKSAPATEAELNAEGLQQILSKLLSHIAWSYLYIYPECVAKKERLAIQQ